MRGHTVDIIKSCSIFIWMPHINYKVLILSTYLLTRKSESYQRRRFSIKLKNHPLTRSGTTTFQQHIQSFIPCPRRHDRRLPVSDQVLHGTLHEFLMVQRKRQLHNVPQLGLGPRVRSPEEQAQATKLPLELLVPRHQQKAERIVAGLLRHHRRRRKGRPALSPLAPPGHVENHVVI